jgi:stress response protein SCP2
MAINLQKGQTINLEKSQYDLSSVTIGLGWDVRKKGGFFRKFIGGESGADYDPDAVAFLLDKNDKVANLGDGRLIGGDVVYFAHKTHGSGAIWLTEDDRTGEGDGDDEQIIVKLDALPARYEKIVFLAAIYQGAQKGQDFSMIQNAYIRAVDARGLEMARFSLSGGDELTGKRSIVFAETYRRDGGWKFRAVGTLMATDDFAQILRNYK